jgi:hypothetical protein
MVKPLQVARSGVATVCVLVLIANDDDNRTPAIRGHDRRPGSLTVRDSRGPSSNLQKGKRSLIARPPSVRTATLLLHN